MGKCQKCDMPLDKDSTCSCEPQVCYHCCSCESGCQCGCQEKEK